MSKPFLGETKIKPVRPSGNGAAVGAPIEWIGGEVKIKLIKMPKKRRK